MDQRTHKENQNVSWVKIILSMMMFVLLFVLSGCGNPNVDVSAYGKEKVEFIGIQNQEKASDKIVLTIDELKALDCVTVKTHSTSDKIGEIKATGPLLQTILAKYGSSLEEYNRIVITATDGYEITLNQPFINDNQLILAFGIDGKPLGDDEKPLRLIIPESDSAYWIRMIHSVEFIK